jgi:hypothetical protein
MKTIILTLVTAFNTLRSSGLSDCGWAANSGGIGWGRIVAGNNDGSTVVSSVWETDPVYEYDIYRDRKYKKTI